VVSIDWREAVGTALDRTDRHVNQSGRYRPHHTMININRQARGVPPAIGTSLIDAYKHTHKTYGLLQPTSNIGK
jgi:hypothetical protein